MQDIDPYVKEEFMLKNFGMSGLDNIASLRNLLYRKHEMPAGAIAESPFGSAIKCIDTKAIQFTLDAGIDPDWKVPELPGIKLNEFWGCCLTREGGPEIWSPLG